PQTVNPKGNLHLGKEAELPTVGNAVLSVPKKRTIGDDGPYESIHLGKGAKLTTVVRQFAAVLACG
ncbi:MAG: hypothetical protein IJA92_04340, partial [Oscillospiraceae bacterium]|nr:hypothetical protein [Oscillospiraceae bacterium]